jgi:hypothetical protein
MKVAHKRYLDNCAKRGVAPVTTQAVPTPGRSAATVVHTSAALTDGDASTSTSASKAMGSERLALLNAAVVTTSTATTSWQVCSESVVQHSNAVVTALNAALSNNGGKGKLERSVVEGVLELAVTAAQQAGAANIAAEGAVTSVEVLRSVLTECVGDDTTTRVVKAQSSGGTRATGATGVRDAPSTDAPAHVSVPELRASIHDDSRSVGCVPSVGAPHGTSSATHGNSVETASKTGTGKGVKQVAGGESKGQGKKQTKHMNLSQQVRRGIVLLLYGVLANTAARCIAQFA